MCVDHYSARYGDFDTSILESIRRETFGEDFGQNGWMTSDEQDLFISWLEIPAGGRALDVACGSVLRGGITGRGRAPALPAGVPGAQALMSAPEARVPGSDPGRRAGRERPATGWTGAVHPDRFITIH